MFPEASPLIPHWTLKKPTQMLANAVGMAHSMGYDDAKHDGKSGHRWGPNLEAGKRQSL